MSGSESARSQDEMKQMPGNALRSEKQKLAPCAQITPGLHFAILWRCHRSLRGQRLRVGRDTALMNPIPAHVPVLWSRKIDTQLVVCWSTFEHFYSAITNEFSLLMLWHFSGKGKTFTIRNRGGRRGRGSCQEEDQRQEEGEREGVWGEEEEEAEARAFILNSESESPIPQPAGGAPGGAGHACGPQRADLLPLQPGLLRRDDRVRQQRLSHRVVPLRLPGHHHQAQGEVVLSPVCSVLQEEAMIENEFDVGAPRSTNIYSSEVFVECNKFDFILFLFWKLNK